MCLLSREQPATMTHAYVLAISGAQLVCVKWNVHVCALILYSSRINSGQMQPRYLDSKSIPIDAHSAP